MKRMIFSRWPLQRLFLTLVLTLCWCALRADIARAGPITYTFESPQFTLAQTTPLLNKPPNVGAGTFLTSFTDTVDPNGYQITAFAANNLMVGQSLFAPIVTSPLTLTFNTPVTELSVDWGINGAVDSFLRLITPSATVDQTASAQNGFPGGTLDFTASIPFTTATLEGFFNGGLLLTQIAIDNLNLTPAVPEPSTFTLLGVGFAALAAWRSKRRTERRVNDKISSARH